MTTRKMRLTIIGLIVLVLLLLILWFLWFLSRPEKPVTVEKTVETSQTNEETTTQPTLKEQQLKQEQDTRNQAAGVTSVAKMFVERYGSYSNEANFQNLIDVLPLMTPAFAEETKNIISKSTIPETYYGVTTKVLIITVENIDETKGFATIRLNTQRQISKDSPQNTNVENQEILLELVRLEGVWKVTSANWQ